MSSTMDFVIRRGRRDDVPALGRLGGLLLRVHYEFDRQRFLAPGDDPEGGYAWFLGSQLEDDDVVVFVAERSRVPARRSERHRRQPDTSAPASGASGLSEPGVSRISSNDERQPDLSTSGEVVGYVYAGLEPLSWKELRDAAGFIHDVVVSADARGHGVATMLVDAAIEWLRERGAPRVMLWTAEQNAEAQRLFTRLGFRRTMIEMTREI
jgi:ribosomal protein S18 acetylase RimI-like enzyme